jgi:integrase
MLFHIVPPMKITGPYQYRTKAGKGRLRLRAKPWRLYHNRQQTWYATKELAEKAAEKLLPNRKRITQHDLAEYWHAREILKGVPLLRAARFYVEAHDGMKHAGALVSELAEKFKGTLAGRKKYLTEAKRCIGLLVEHCGTMRITAATPSTIEDFLARFDSAWSHDQALKFARAFFKWCASPQIHARRDNPTAIFKFKNPAGSRVHLALDDALHLLKTTRAEFPEILPAIALQMFAGIRTEEITKLDWKFIRRGRIRLEPEVAKMGQVKGKRVPRFVDWWPVALDVWMPAKFPAAGPLGPVTENLEKGKLVVRSQYLVRKGELLERCRETKPDFRWGQNAMRHSYGTYGLAFFQSADRIAKLMGERDVDTVFNHYADYAEMDDGQKYFSIGSDRLEALPLPKNALELFQKISQQAQAQPRPASEQPAPQVAS